MLNVPSKTALALSTLLATTPELAAPQSNNQTDAISSSVSSLVSAINESNGTCYLSGTQGPESLRVVSNYHNLNHPVPSSITRIEVPAEIESDSISPALNKLVANYGFLILEATDVEKYADGSIGWTINRGVFDPDLDEQAEKHFGFNSEAEARDFYRQAIADALKSCADIYSA